jgi:hypothetical protein
MICTSSLRWPSFRAQGCAWPLTIRNASRLIRQVTILARLASSGNPSYFQFERKGPVHTRLGPGVTRVSDSFWPLMDW